MTPLEICLGISGRFEGGDGGPRWDLISGNFDGMWVSVGALQWNPGTGSIQKLINLTAGKMADTSTFGTIVALGRMNAASGTAYAVSKWIGPNKKVLPKAQALWTEFLNTPECIEAQQELAQEKLDKAVAEATKFMPFLSEIDQRTMAFFFDVRVQQGSLTKIVNGVLWAPEILQSPEEANWSRAVDMASLNGKKQTAAAWGKIAPEDPLSQALLHYAYERAVKARTEYQWDTLSRRGSIACRQGGVHGVWFDFMNILP